MRTAIVSILGIAVIVGLTWLGTRESDGWRLTEGRVVERDGHWVAEDDSVFRLGDLEARVPQGTVLASAPSGDRWPATIRGAVEVSGQGRLTVEDRRVELEGSRLTLTPGPSPAVGPAARATPERSSPESYSRPVDEAASGGANGIVVDARHGRPLRDSRVTATYSYSDDGYPPHPDAGSVVAVVTDGSGAFELTPFRPFDPRLKLHLEVEHAGFLPAVHVLQRGVRAGSVERQGHGWPRVTVRLRRGPVTTLRLVDEEGGALARVAVTVDPNRALFFGEDAWRDEQDVRLGREVIRYTDARGELRASLNSSRPQVLDPALFLTRGLGSRVPWGCFIPPDYDPADAALHLFHTAAADVHSYRVVDRDEVPVANTLIEIQADRLIRLHTGPDGEFPFGVIPACPELPAITTENPVWASVRTLSPYFWRVEVDAAFPARALESELELSRRRSPELRLRCVKRTDEGIVGIAPDRVALIDLDMTPVELHPEGDAVWVGNLPRPDDRFEVFVPGYSPVEVHVPHYSQGELLDNALDLGDVEFFDDRAMTFRLSVGEPSRQQFSAGDRNDELVRAARLWVVDEERPQCGQELRFSGKSEARATGLVLGRDYRYVVTGSGLEPIEGRFDAMESVLEEGLDIELIPSGETDVFLTGSVRGLDEEEVHRYQVIERYFLANETDPVTFTPYPLAQDFVFGSRRVLADAVEAEVAVYGPTGRFAHRRATISNTDRHFDIGPLAIDEPYTATVVWVLEGLGVQAQVPAEVSLFAETDAYHEIARYSQDTFEMRIEGLMPGHYVLRWGGASTQHGATSEVLEESFPFEVLAADRHRRLVVPRVQGEVEQVVLTVQDLLGQPIDSARIAVLSEGASEATRSIGNGRYQVPLFTTTSNRYSIRAPGFAGVTVTYPVEQGPVDPIALRRTVIARGEVLGQDDRRFEGELELHWSTDTETATGADDKVRVESQAQYLDVVRGAFEARVFPEGTTRVSFRHVDSELEVWRTVRLSPKRQNKLGTLRLVESRALSGQVLLPGGAPAADVELYLVPPRFAYRYPQRPFRKRAVRYSARTDGSGNFRIDGLPLEFSESLALVAHRRGYTDAIVDPIDPNGWLPQDLQLELGEETRLLLEVGYKSGDGHEDFEFRLSYSDDLEAGEDFLDLGPVSTGQSFREYMGITPGLYRLVWREKASGAVIEERVVQLDTFRSESLSLIIKDQFVSGTALLNGRSLRDGWITAYGEDDEDPRVARIRNGRFVVPLPERARTARVAVLPEEVDPTSVRPALGEAVPHAVYDLPAADLRVSYQGYDVTIQIDPDLLEEEELQIEFPHYRWTGRSWRQHKAREPVTDSEFKLRLVAPGLFTFKVISRRGWTRTRTVEVSDEAVSVWFER